jgi:hypothetical protein
MFMVIFLMVTRRRTRWNSPGELMGSCRIETNINNESVSDSPSHCNCAKMKFRSPTPAEEA